MMNLQMSCDLTQIHAIHVHFSGSFTQAIQVAVLFRFGGVLSLTVHTAIPLRTCICFACFVLTCCRLTIGTFHPFILAHPFSHSVLSGWQREFELNNCEPAYIFVKIIDFIGNDLYNLKDGTITHAGGFLDERPYFCP